MRIAVQNIYSKLFQYTDAEEDLLASILCVSKPRYQFTRSFKEKKWDGMRHFYSEVSKTFPTGFLPFVIEQAHAKRFRIETDDYRKVPATQDPTSIGERYPKLKDYQRETVTQVLAATLRSDNAVLPWSRGIIKYPPDTGKTMMAACIADFLHKKTLYVIERQVLMYQTCEEFKRETSLSVGLLGDNQEDFTSQVTIAMAQTIRAAFEGESLYRKKTADKDISLQRLKELRTRKRLMEDFLSTKECLIYDECHHLSNGVYHKIALKCPAPFRYGLSATPLKRGDLGDVYLIGDTGEILAEGDGNELRRQGHIGKPKVYMFTVTQPQLGHMPFQQAYELGIIENDYRNEMVVTAIRKLRGLHCTILVLVRYLPHGKDIQARLARQGIQALCISGTDSMAKRKKALQAFGDTSQVLIATKILNEGVSLPALNAVVRAGGWGSDILSIQEVGRGRVKGRIYIVDFNDLTHKDLRKHSAMHIATYEEQGFPVIFPKHV